MDLYDEPIIYDFQDNYRPIPSHIKELILNWEDDSDWSHTVVFLPILNQKSEVKKVSSLSLKVIDEVLYLFRKDYRSNRPIIKIVDGQISDINFMKFINSIKSKSPVFYNEENFNSYGYLLSIDIKGSVYKVSRILSEDFQIVHLLTKEYWNECTRNN